MVSNLTADDNQAKNKTSNSKEIGISQAIASLGVGVVGLGEGKENSRIFGQVISKRRDNKKDFNIEILILIIGRTIRSDPSKTSGTLSYGPFVSF